MKTKDYVTYQSARLSNVLWPYISTQMSDIVDNQNNYYITGISLNVAYFKTVFDNIF